MGEQRFLKVLKGYLFHAAFFSEKIDGCVFADSMDVGGQLIFRQAFQRVQMVDEVGQGGLKNIIGVPGIRDEGADGFIHITSVTIIDPRYKGTVGVIVDRGDHQWKHSVLSVP